MTECRDLINEEQSNFNNICDLIVIAFKKEVEDYNRILKESNAWENRRKELLNTRYSLFIDIQRELDRARKLIPIKREWMFNIQNDINSNINYDLNIEFGIIDLYESTISKFGYTDLVSIVKAKLTGQNITDFDVTMDNTIDWLKEKLEIYI